MLAIEAHRLGVTPVIYSGAEGEAGTSPAGQVVATEFAANFSDAEMFDQFLEMVDVVTVEFENVPREALERAQDAEKTTHPVAEVLAITSDRIAERSFLTKHSFPVADHRTAADRDELTEAVETLGRTAPVVVKTSTGGYDGKGQVTVAPDDDGTQLAAAVELVEAGPVLAESFCEFECEASVVLARDRNGELADYGLVRNDHQNHILDTSVAPWTAGPKVEQDAIGLARAISTEIGMVGVMAVEMFVMSGGDLVVNELAPRVHNSGHLTIEASPTNQFAQHVRAVCGLPLGATKPLRAVAMANVLGDAYDSGEPDWAAALTNDGVSLHAYGKADPRPGRKMAHLCATGSDPADALARVRDARRALRVAER